MLGSNNHLLAPGQSWRVWALPQSGPLYGVFFNDFNGKVGAQRLSCV